MKPPRMVAAPSRAQLRAELSAATKDLHEASTALEAMKMVFIRCGIRFERAKQALVVAS